MGTHQYKYNWDFFEKDSEELYYFLGFVAADGYISDNDIEIGLNIKDKCLLEHFRDLIVPNKPIYDKRNTNSCLLKISCTSKISKIKELFSMSSNKKHCEIKFPDIPQKYWKHFIRGYIDGDGCIDTTKAYRGEKIYIGLRLRILGNYDFLNKLNDITKNIYPHKTNAINKKGFENVYVLTYNFSTAKNILKWVYDDCTIYLKRKYDKYNELLELTT